eukprot:TRINITY_DN5577_c0_g1_i13.p1 TRINITY_DN5577_c0_g1~~TRINITY_DN5577_c0_g1_i13.p1  ORF type:complete len:158 (-),score=24.64 TRINITY_DN5577_c0_g1_i13:138-611(-)
MKPFRPREKEREANENKRHIDIVHYVVQAHSSIPTTPYSGLICFKGSDATTWFHENLFATREESVDWGRYLQRLEIIRSASGVTKFKDDGTLFYWHTRIYVASVEQHTAIDSSAYNREFLDPKVFEIYSPPPSLKKEALIHWNAAKKKWNNLKKPKL